MAWPWEILEEYGKTAWKQVKWWISMISPGFSTNLGQVETEQLKKTVVPKSAAQPKLHFDADKSSLITLILDCWSGGVTAFFRKSRVLLKILSNPSHN